MNEILDEELIDIAVETTEYFDSFYEDLDEIDQELDLDYKGE